MVVSTLIVRVMGEQDVPVFFGPIPAEPLSCYPSPHNPGSKILKGAIRVIEALQHCNEPEELRAEAVELVLLQLYLHGYSAGHKHALIDRSPPENWRELRLEQVFTPEVTIAAKASTTLRTRLLLRLREGYRAQPNHPFAKDHPPIRTLGQLAELTELDVLMWQGLGRKALNYANVVLARYGQCIAAR